MTETKRNVTEKSYLQIKALTDSGLNNKIVGQALDVGVITVSRVRATTDWDDFVARKAACRAKARVKRIEKMLEPTARKAVNYTNETARINPDALNHTPATDPFVELNKTLTEAVTQLTRLADAWEASPKRGGLFNKRGE